MKACKIIQTCIGVIGLILMVGSFIYMAAGCDPDNREDVNVGWVLCVCL